MYKKLADITSKIGSGSTPKGGEKSYKTQGVSFIRSQNILDFYFSKKNLFFIDEKQAEILNGVTVKEGDVLLNITGDSVARCCIVADEILPARVNQHVAIIRSLDRKLSYFLMYYLHFMKPHLLTICKIGGTRKALTKEMLENLPIIANGNYQQIGFTLAKIDKKISINNSIISKLEEMAKTIYEYWFLQFDFPNSEGKPYASSGGAMKYSEELGREIPIDWEVKYVKHFCEVQTGSEDANFATPHGRYKFFTCAQETYQCDIPAFEGHAILIAGNGDFNVKHYSGEFNAYQRTYVLLPKKQNYALLYFVVQQRITYFKKGSNGSIVKFIRKSDVENIPIPHPNDTKILDTLNHFILMKEQKMSENQKLAQLRDWLLPMLMNGQVRVE